MLQVYSFELHRLQFEEHGDIVFYGDDADEHVSLLAFLVLAVVSPAELSLVLIFLCGVFLVGLAGRMIVVAPSLPLYCLVSTCLRSSAPWNSSTLKSEVLVPLGHSLKRRSVFYCS